MNTNCFEKVTAKVELHQNDCSCYYCTIVTAPSVLIDYRTQNYKSSLASHLVTHKLGPRRHSYQILILYFCLFFKNSKTIIYCELCSVRKR